MKIPAMIFYDMATKVLDTESFPQHIIAGLMSGIIFILLFSQEKPLRLKEINTHTQTHDQQMTSKKSNGAGEHPRPTYFRDFAPMPFGKLMELLITSIWHACLFHFLTWLDSPFKSVLPALTRCLIEK